MNINEKLLSYFKNDEFASQVWGDKYRQSTEVTPDDMHMRMTKEFARVRFIKDKSKTLKEWTTYFFDIFKNFGDVIPQGRVMAGVGVFDSYRSLSNCLRLPPPEDSYSSIMRTDTMLVSSAKRGCGYGVGLSKLRPYGARTSNSAKTSTGVIPFGERYSNSTKEVGQEGRRGACLEDLDIRHPDAPRWAVVKLDKTKFTGSNISFKMYDDFLNAVKKNEDYILRYPVNQDLSYFSKDYLDSNYDELYYIEDHKKNNDLVYLKKVKARDLWNKSIHTVWSDGCPGLQFWDRIMNYDPSSVYEKYRIDGTNACGEQPMAVYDTCRLLVIALIRAIKNAFTNSAILDEKKLYNLTYTMMEIGDDLIDLEVEYLQRIITKIKSDPEDKATKAIELELWENVLDMAKSGRRIGAGITGLADMLAAVNIKYDSQEALDFTEKVMRIKFTAELDASIDLAEKYGTFKGWDAKLEKNGNDWYRFVEKEFPNQWKRMQKSGRRFVNSSTIAPVGTTSIITPVVKYFNISSGCEPQFGLWFFRNKKVETESDPYDFTDEVGIRWKQYPVIMGAFKDWLEINQGVTDFDSLTKIELEDYYKKSPWYNCTANDIDWRKRIDMQAVLQKYTTSAISSTLNLPKDVKEEVISDIYMYAHEKELKGVTCYRDGSKGGVLVTEERKDSNFDYKDSYKRPKEIKGDAHVCSVAGTAYNVFVGLVNNKPYEIFIQPDGNIKGEGLIVKQKKGEYCFVHNNKTDCILTENITDEQAVISRLVSTSLRHGTDIRFIIEQLNKSNGSVVSFNKALARTLKKYITDGTEVKEKCDNCGAEAMIYVEGCKTCQACGSSKC